MTTNTFQDDLFRYFAKESNTVFVLKQIAQQEIVTSEDIFQLLESSILTLRMLVYIKGIQQQTTARYVFAYDSLVGLHKNLPKPPSWAVIKP